MEAAASEPWVKGSMGQLKPYPGFMVAARCDEVAAKLALQLRMLGAFGPPRGPDGFGELNAFDQFRARRAQQAVR